MLEVLMIIKASKIQTRKLSGAQALIWKIMAVVS